MKHLFDLFKDQLIDVVINRPQVVLSEASEGVAVDDPTTTLSGHLYSTDEHFIYLTKNKDNSEEILAISYTSIMVIMQASEESLDEVILPDNEVIN